MGSEIGEYVRYQQDITDCMQTRIGTAGLTQTELEENIRGLAPALNNLAKAYDDRSLPLLRLPETQDDLEKITEIAQVFQAFQDVVILGTGGSSLGGQALCNISLEAAQKKSLPTLHTVTSIDPASWHRLWTRLDVAKTGVIVISKSGTTAETLMPFLTLLPVFRNQLGDGKLKNHFALISEPGQNPLRKIAEDFALPICDHDPKLGGRYAVLSVVGLLPAMIAGLNVAEIRAGAKSVLDKTLNTNAIAEIEPAIGAALMVGLAQKRKISSAVMLVYADRLAALAYWYRQLWAESIGKEGQGTTPIHAIGPEDQHSQLQLWLEGPADKIFTILGGTSLDKVPAIDAAIARKLGLDYMAGRDLGALLDAARFATGATLAHHHRPVRRFTMEVIDESTMGQVMMHFMLETILAAHLMRVNPFNQPAVEHGKQLLRQYMDGLEG